MANIVHIIILLTHHMYVILKLLMYPFYGWIQEKKPSMTPHSMGSIPLDRYIVTFLKSSE
jgi:hypothetical protein